MTNIRDQKLNISDYDSEEDRNQLALEKNEFVNITEEQAMNVNSLPSDLNKEVENNKSIEAYHDQPEARSNNFDFQQSSANSGNINTANSLNSVGHSLRNARLAKKLNVEDVARQLRLSVQQIEAIEREDFEKLPGRTFLRGFIRNYANLVQLDPSPLLKMLPAPTRVISTHENTPFKNTQISFSSQRKSARNNSLTIISIVFIVIVGIYFLFGNNFLINNEFNNKDVVSDVKIDSKTATVDIPLTLPAVTKYETIPVVKQSPELDDSGNNQTLLNPASEAESEPPPPASVSEEKPNAPEVKKPAALPDGKDHLFFTFTEDSWIKVVDGSGASLFEQLKKAGSEQAIAGKKPFSIVIGNASGANLTYNDKEIDISTYKRRDGTARFKLE